MMKVEESMNTYLVNASISGLWATEQTLRLPLDPKFNFIIGKNGTGKTTVINLIAAVLTADFDRLDKIQFSRVVLTLAEKGGRKRPSIEVVKTQKPNLPYFDIAYKIKMAAGSEAKTFDLDALEEERAFRGVPPRMLRERYYKEKYLYIQKHLESLVQVSWLSVHRQVDIDRHSDERRASLPAIDQKLANMNIALAKYFAKLASTFSDETQNFQKTSFLSLISIQKDADIRSFVQKLNIDEERKSLGSILELLGVTQQKYSRQLDQIFQQFAEAKDPFLGNDPIAMTQLFAVANSFKTHSLVQHYEVLQAKKRRIFEPIDKFLKVINALFAPRKTLSISDQNELVIKNSGGTTIEIEDLSSGEKQLLIILGQALLQESSAVIYIADEPELSLHVEWQERITHSISQLNPNAQIVFATHSPDIVGLHTDKIIDMELKLA
jgi:predicted ATPase